jgi:hypothetical protein
MSPTPLIVGYAQEVYNDQVVQEATEDTIIATVWESALCMATDYLDSESRDELLTQVGWELAHQLYNEHVSDSEGEVSTRELCRVLIGLEALYHKVSGHQ